MSISWEHIKNICDQCHENTSDLDADLLHTNRTPQVVSNYKKWKEEGSSNILYDCIFNPTPHQPTNQPTNQSNQPNPTVLRLNDFPYNFESGILHYVLWLRPNQKEYRLGSRIGPKLGLWVDNKLKLNHPNYITFVHFRNSPKLRTIDFINHYHVIVRLGR